MPQPDVPGGHKAAAGPEDRLGHHSIKVHGEAALDRLDQQRGGRARGAQPGAPLPGNLEPSEHTRGVTDCSVTPREFLVELRGLEPLTPRLPALCSPS